MSVDLIIECIARTLLHSLWQGLLICLWVALAMVISRNQSAQLRYGLLVGSLALFPLAFGATLYIEWVAVQESLRGSAELANGIGLSSGEKLHFVLQLLAKAWCLGAVLHMLRGLIAWRLTTHMMHRFAQAPDPVWQKLLGQLLERLDIERQVVLRVSRQVNVPMVIGHLKPVILVPVGMLSGLPSEEVEAILLHELAHIKRNDYLVNLLHVVLESLFFYHPGFWWISKQLRVEREHCCDDLAVQVSDDPFTLAKALVHLEEVPMNDAPWAMAATGRSGLRARVERLLQPHCPQISRSWRPVLDGGPVLLLILVTLTGCALASHSITQPQTIPQDLQFIKNVLDEKGLNGIYLPIDNKEMLILVGEQGISLEVDGENHPVGELLPYTEQIRASLRSIDELEIARKQRQIQKAEQSNLEVSSKQLALEQAALTAEQERHQAEEFQKKHEMLSVAELALAAKVKQLESERLQTQLLLQTTSSQEKQQRLAERQATQQKLERLQQALVSANRHNLEFQERLALIQQTGSKTAPPPTPSAASAATTPTAPMAATSNAAPPAVSNTTTPAVSPSPAAAAPSPSPAVSSPAPAAAPSRPAPAAAPSPAPSTVSAEAPAAAASPSSRAVSSSAPTASASPQPAVLVSPKADPSPAPAAPHPKTPPSAKSTESKPRPEYSPAPEPGSRENRQVYLP